MTRHTAHFDSSAAHFCVSGEGFGRGMDASTWKQSDHEGMASGVSSFLSNLPSRCLFSSTALSSNPGGMRVYICEHDTSPPEGQQIKTNQQNILIRSLMINSKKAESSTKDKAAGDGPRKRAAEKGLDSKSSAKRANSQASTKAEGSSSRPVDKDFQSLTVERLRALLKEKGLSPKGKKDELIARLKNAS